MYRSGSTVIFTADKQATEFVPPILKVLFPPNTFPKTFNSSTSTQLEESSPQPGRCEDTIRIDVLLNRN